MLGSIVQRVSEKNYLVKEDGRPNNYLSYAPRGCDVMYPSEAIEFETFKDATGRTFAKNIRRRVSDGNN